MKHWFQQKTLRGKIQTVILSVAALILLLLFVTQVAYQFFALRNQILEDTHLLADSLNKNASAPLIFNDQRTAEELLAGLALKSQILSGLLLNRSGDVFAQYGEGQNSAYLAEVAKEIRPTQNYVFYADHLCLHQPVIFEGEWLGTLVLQTSLIDVQTSMLRFTLTWGVTILVAGLLSYVLSRAFREVISGPIERLALAMKAVSEEKTYSLRIDEKGQDELAQLTAGFNEMLEQIEIRDSELILHRDRLNHMAHHDSLTGLPNRLLFNDRLQQAIQRSERSKRPLALIFIDLDRFKNINDTLGHDVGDMVLVEAAHRLELCLRKSDTVARLGGDEFVVVLEEFESQESVARISRKIIDELSQECCILEHRLYVTASLGVSFYPDNGTDLTTLKRCADIAMFRAKETGRNNFQFFLPGMGEGFKKMLALESDLRVALERGELRLFFQPQVSMKTGQVCAAEALLRWQHPSRGLILPGEFIPLAEETGLIVELGEWALREACCKVKSLLDQGFEPICCCVNVSPRQFRQANLIEIVQKILEESGLPPSLLELEVTETLLMHDIEDAIDKMNQLKELGVLLAIDDFGSGYSSLSYLKHFPINKLKIDRGFIRDLHQNRYDLAIAASVASLAQIMGLEALAEGVETRQQEDALLGLGMEWAQGFLYQVPLPFDQFAAFLPQPDKGADAQQPQLVSAEDPPCPGSEGLPLLKDKSV